MNTPSVDLALAPPEHTRVGTIIALIFLLITTIVAALFVSFAALKMLQQQDALTNWPSTPGAVTASSVQQQTNQAAGVGRAGSATTSSYTPIIEHTYSVDSIEYTSTRATPLNSDGSSTWADAIVSSHPPAATVTVYYNPIDPVQSFVVRHWDDTLIIVALFASFTPCFIAFLVTAGGLRKYTLKWTLPSLATAVYALGLTACAAIYFGIVPKQDFTDRASLIFTIAFILLLTAVWLTSMWRNQHLDWRRMQSPKTKI
jgi:multisubunit Na+/H+ antiporter MnhG subunit